MNCIHQGCDKNPNYNFPDEDNPICCWYHKIPGMVDLISFKEIIQKFLSLETVSEIQDYFIDNYFFFLDNKTYFREYEKVKLCEKLEKIIEHIQRTQNYQSQNEIKTNEVLNAIGKDFTDFIIEVKFQDMDIYPKKIDRIDIIDECKICMEDMIPLNNMNYAIFCKKCNQMIYHIDCYRMWFLDRNENVRCFNCGV
jgi:hypothetical protein